MKYKVKLNGNNTARLDQQKDGYLANFDRIAFYSKGEAITKARMFGGKIEAVELSKVFNTVKMIQIPENSLLDGVVKELQGRESFVDTDEDLNEKIYTGDVFEAILSEDSGQLKTKVVKQLEELAQLIDSEYVQITQI